MKQGIFYAVGVGAGDPMDMTLRAKAVLEQADIIVTPIPKAGGTSAAYAIAAQASPMRNGWTFCFPCRHTTTIGNGFVPVYCSRSVQPWTAAGRWQW